MTTVSKINDIHQLLKLWPRLLKLTKGEQPNVEAEHLLQLFLQCLKNGAVFIVKSDSGLVGSACVETIGFTAKLHSLPKDEGRGYGKHCIQAIRQWAKLQGLVSVQVSTTRLCGSSFRYFEKSLGFRRRAVTFNMDI